MNIIRIGDRSYQNGDQEPKQGGFNPEIFRHLYFLIINANRFGEWSGKVVVGAARLELATAKRDRF